MTKARNLGSIASTTNPSTEALALPRGTTAQRPSSPITGMSRFNTTTGLSEYWNGTNWSTYGSTFTPTVHYLVVAGGGAGGLYHGDVGYVAGNVGSNSTFATITSTGGGGGRAWNTPGTPNG